MRTMIIAVLLLAAGCSQEVIGSATSAPSAVVADPESLPDRSPPSDQAVALTFINETEGPVDILWLDFEGDLTRYTSLAPDGEYLQPTYVGHIWIVRDADGRERMRFAAAKTSQVVIG
ncbi:MAG TPA: hypothetical protein VM677_31960 [Actinokineospora sp.]|nr:hypothetical protein [Actinokineospora sp.]